MTVMDPKQVEKELEVKGQEPVGEVPSVLDEINIEELAVDGICGIY